MRSVRFVAKTVTFGYVGYIGYSGYVIVRVNTGSISQNFDQITPKANFRPGIDW